MRFGQVVNNPEILTVLNNIPNLGQFMNSLYNCEYKKFFEAMVEIGPALRRDRYFARHTDYAIREFRIRGYSQLLQSYKSVTLASMASGVAGNGTPHRLLHTGAARVLIWVTALQWSAVECVLRRAVSACQWNSWTRSSHASSHRDASQQRLTR